MVKRVAFLAVFLLSAALVQPVAAYAATGSTVSMVRLPLGERPALEPMGVVQPERPLHIRVMLRPRHPGALARLATAVSTPGSPEYHHYLKKGMFASQYGASPKVVAETMAWLRSKGLQPGPLTDGLYIPVTVTTGQAEQAFSTQLLLYRLPSGRVAMANQQPPLVPSSLAPYIQSIVGLSTLGSLRPSLSFMTRSDTASTADHAVVDQASQAAGPLGPQACSAASSGMPTGVYTYTQIANAYSYSSLYVKGIEGNNVTVGIFATAAFNPSDIAQFQSCYGTDATVNVVNVDGGPSSTSLSSADSMEATLDIETIIAMSPMAQITVYEGRGDSLGDSLDIFSSMVNEDTASVLNISFGVCEPAASTDSGYMSSFNVLAEQAAAQGETVLASSGDAGSEGCYGESGLTTTEQDALAVDFPASDPYVTGVGGVTLLQASSPPSQTAWNDGCSAGSCSAGGGGISQRWPMPSWQRGPGVISSYSSGLPCNNPSGYCREVPDVSMVASGGVTIYYTGGYQGIDGWVAVGGTSLAAPSWAALVALADQGCNSPVGFINPVLYSPPSYVQGSLFYGVTSGNNDATGTNQGRYPAGVGYNLATGLGTPVADEVLTALQPEQGCTVPSPSPSPTPTPAPAPTASSGYLIAAANGSVFSFGEVSYEGSAYGKAAGAPISSIAIDPASQGYWLLSDNGSVFGFGAPYFGSAYRYIGFALASSIAATPNGQGYWILTTNGSVFGFGDAPYYGSAYDMIGETLAKAIVPTPNGQGYWILTTNGSVFGFGDAPYYGSAYGYTGGSPALSMAATPNGQGYWILTTNGSVFTFGNAKAYGTGIGLSPYAALVAIVPTSDGQGYWLVSSNGSVFGFGDAPYYGSAYDILGDTFVLAAGGY